MLCTATLASWQCTPGLILRRAELGDVCPAPDSYPFGCLLERCKDGSGATLPCPSWA